MIAIRNQELIRECVGSGSIHERSFRHSVTADQGSVSSCCALYATWLRLVMQQADGYVPLPFTCCAALRLMARPVCVYVTQFPFRSLTQMMI